MTKGRLTNVDALVRQIGLACSDLRKYFGIENLVLRPWHKCFIVPSPVSVEAEPNAKFDGLRCPREVAQDTRSIKSVTLPEVIETKVMLHPSLA